MRPPAGQPWESWEHRAATVLAGLCDALEVAERVETPTLAAQPLFVVHVPESGPAEEFFARPQDPRSAAFVRGEMVY